MSDNNLQIEWKEIFGYDYQYFVSNTGLVKTLDKIDTIGRRVNGKILKTDINDLGHICINLIRDRKIIPTRVCKLVLSAFQKETEKSHVIIHKDENKLNNCINNLRYYIARLEQPNRKVCLKCDQLKNIEKFVYNPITQTYKNQCLNCQKIYEQEYYKIDEHRINKNKIEKEWRHKNSEKVKLDRLRRTIKKNTEIQQKLQQGEVVTKYCSGCEQTKDIMEFWKDVNRCKNCKKQYNQQYCIREKDKIKANRTRYQETNKENLKRKRKEKREKNKEFYNERQRINYHKNKNNPKRREQNRRYRNNRRKNDYHYRMRMAVNGRINSELKRYKLRKVNRTYKYLGCSIELFVKYIESKFESWMTWNNHGSGPGKWELDHIKCCRSFNFNNEDEVYECFHFSNHQPLAWEKNKKKSDYISENLRASQIKKYRENTFIMTRFTENAFLLDWGGATKLNQP